MALEHAVLVAGEEETVIRLVDADQAGHRPSPARDRDQLAADEAVEMVEAASLRSPDEAAVLQRMEIAVEVDPGLRGLAENGAAGAARRIDSKKIEALLVAALALDVKGAPVLRPVDTGEIDVGIGAEVDLGSPAARGIDHPKRHNHVGSSRGGIALIEHLGPVRTDCSARHGRDLRFVVAFDRDAPVAGRPPGTGVAVHLLLRDELGGAAGDRALAIRRQRPFGAGAKIDGIEVLVTDEADVAPAFRHVRVDLGRRRVRQAADRAGGHIREVEIAVDGREDRFAVRRPLIFDNALGAADAVAFAAHLFGLGNLAAADPGGIDEHAQLACRRVHCPEVEALSILGARLEESGMAPVGREFEDARGLPGDWRTGEDPLDRELLLGNAGRRSEGEQERRNGSRDKETHASLYPGEGRGPVQQE